MSRHKGRTIPFSEQARATHERIFNKQDKEVAERLSFKCPECGKLGRYSILSNCYICPNGHPPFGLSFTKLGGGSE
jgi:hypothetical protein